MHVRCTSFETPDADETDERLPRPPKAALRRARRVLVVEDDEDTAELLAEGLRRFGHTPMLALDGLTAIELSAQFGPDVALVDLELPDMDGCEVGRRLRALQLGCPSCLIAVTSHSTLDDRRRTRLAGFDAHVAKPIDMAVLARMLEGALPLRH